MIAVPTVAQETKVAPARAQFEEIFSKWKDNLKKLRDLNEKHTKVADDADVPEIRKLIDARLPGQCPKPRYSRVGAVRRRKDVGRPVVHLVLRLLPGAGMPHGAQLIHRESPAVQANAFLDETGAQRSALRLICSEPSETFGAQLAEGLGLHPGALLSTWKTHADTHTSACTLGWHLARERQPLSDGERVLFVNAGGGLTVGCALYEHVAR